MSRKQNMSAGSTDAYGLVSFVDDIARYQEEVHHVHESKTLDWLMRIIDRIDKKDDLVDIAKFFLTELLASNTSGTFARERMLEWNCYGLIYDRLQRTCQVSLVEPFLEHLDGYRKDIRTYEARTRDDRSKKRRLNAAAAASAAVLASNPTTATPLTLPSTELDARARVRFTISSANIMPSKKTEHRYTKQPTVNSGAMCDGRTYCINNKLPPISLPDARYGNFDFNNHAFLVTSDERYLRDPSFAGKRITISKLTNIEFSLLAMQVLSGRTTCDVKEEHRDKTFIYLLRIFSDRQDVDRAIPAPSSMTRAQKCELIFAYLYSHILEPSALPAHIAAEINHVSKDNASDTATAAASTAAIDRTLQSIQSFYLHCGARITATKYPGWIQNPRRFGHK